MSESPNDNPPRAPIADAVGGERESRGRPWLWPAGAFALAAALVVVLVVWFPGRSREELAATQAAVAQCAELYRESPARIYKYSKIRAESRGDGEWRVSITRFVIPDNASDFGITSNFRVRRDGTCEYVGQKVGREH